MHKRRTSEIDLKLQHMRFLGELVKFRVCPPDTAFKYLEVTQSKCTYMQLFFAHVDVTSSIQGGIPCFG